VEAAGQRGSASSEPGDLPAASRARLSAVNRKECDSTSSHLTSRPGRTPAWKSAARSRSTDAMNTRTSRLHLGALAGAVTLVCLLPIEAQQASITGTITDSESVLPDVTVTLRSSVAATRSTTTDQQGRFRFSALNPGYYDLTFARNGFEAATRTISVSGGSATLDVALKPGILSTRLIVDAVFRSVRPQNIGIVSMNPRYRADAVRRKKLILVQHHSQNSPQLRAVHDRQ